VILRVIRGYTDEGKVLRCLDVVGVGWGTGYIQIVGLLLWAVAETA
jgi:hypothetical protein